MVLNTRNIRYRYLIGESTEEESCKIEERARIDDDYRERLREAEYDLIAAYVAGDLTLHTRESFETYFLRSKGRLEKLRLAKLLFECAQNAAARFTDAGDPFYRYFVGVLAPDEQVRIEERSRIDDDYKRQLESAEHELIVAYTLEDPSGTEREKFQGYFFDSEDKIEKLRFAEAMYEYYEYTQWIETQESIGARWERLRQLLAIPISISISPRLTWQRSTAILGVFIFIMSFFIKVGMPKPEIVGRDDTKMLIGAPTFQSSVIEQKGELRPIRRLRDLHSNHRRFPMLRSETNKPAVELPEVNMLNVADVVLVPAWNAKELDWRIMIEQPNHPPAMPQPEAETPATNAILRGNRNISSLGVRQGSALLKAQPVYPQNARRFNASGAVEVQIAVAATGRVSASKAISGHLLLRKAAEKAARNWVFNPTTVNGHPVDTQLVLTFVFTVPR